MSPEIAIKLQDYRIQETWHQSKFDENINNHSDQRINRSKGVISTNDGEFMNEHESRPLQENYSC